MTFLFEESDEVAGQAQILKSTPHILFFLFSPLFEESEEAAGQVQI
jgi:hypothetical protein